MIKEYFKALWQLTVICAFHLLVSFIFGLQEQFYTNRGIKNRVSKEEVKTMSNDVFKKRFKKYFKLTVKKEKSKIKRHYYEMKFCKTQMTALDSFYEMDRAFRSNGVYLPYKKDILTSYLEAKKSYEESVGIYNGSLKSLNDYLHSVSNILCA